MTTDTTQAAVAAALMQAAERFPDGRQPWPPHAIRKAILAMIPADAMAALEAVKAEARREAVDAMTAAPERIWADMDIGMVGTGRWVTQGTENPFGRVEYIAATKVQKLIRAAVEKERERCAAWCKQYANSLRKTYVSNEDFTVAAYFNGMADDIKQGENPDAMEARDVKGE
jgi:hypothetical protein